MGINIETFCVAMLGLVDDTICVSEAGFQAQMLNVFFNVKTAEKTLQFGPDKCKRMHVGKEWNKIICRKTQVSEWKVELRKDNISGKMKLVENMNGDVKGDETYAEKYLGTWIESRGGNMKTIDLTLIYYGRKNYIDMNFFTRL